MRENPSAAPRPPEPRSSTVARTAAENPVVTKPDNGGSGGSGDHNHVVRSWRARLQPGLRELAEARARGELEGGFTMPLFDGEEVRIHVRRLDTAGEGRGTFRGSVNGYPGSLAVFSYVGGVESGTIQIPSRGEVYNVRTDEHGLTRMEQIDTSELGACGVCVELAEGTPDP